MAKAATMPSERLILFLQAVLGLNNDPSSWTLPADWQTWLTPANRAQQDVALERLVSEGRESKEDWAWYRRDPVGWRVKRTSEGLVVFSKSYCPYSKKAKKLLSDLGAKFTVVEVDLRPDYSAFQPALAQVTGHRTFPTVVLGGGLLGGSDDLQELHASNELRGLLQGVGAL